MDKWWVEIPLIHTNSQIPNDNYFIPCSYNDYKAAVKGEIPERWWKAFQKMNQE